MGVGGPAFSFGAFWGLRDDRMQHYFGGSALKTKPAHPQIKRLRGLNAAIQIL